MRPSEGFLQLVQLITREGGPVSPLLPSRGVFIVKSGTRTGRWTLGVRQIGDAVRHAHGKEENRECS